MKANLAANIWGESGYSRHARSLAIALIEEGTDLSIECFSFVPNWQSLTPKLLRSAMDKDNRDAANVIINLPPYWMAKSGDRVKLHGFCVFEGNQLPFNWTKMMNKSCVTSVLVPSNHVKEACFNSGIKKDVHVIPHGFDPRIFHPNQEKINLPEMDADKFSFLYVGGYKDGERDRKGLDIALRAFCAEFKPEEKVIFRAKINTAYCSPEQTMQKIMELNLPEKKLRPKIPTDFTNYPDVQMAQIYASHDVLVAPSKAEAFNLPCLESLACGTPVITTNYGGQLDYVNNENGWLFDIECMEKATGEPWIYEDTEWAKPSQKALQETMRFAKDNPSEVEKKRLKAAESVKHLTWQNSARKLISVVAGYEA